MRIRAGKQTHFSACGVGLWRASSTAGVVVRKELKVYFNLPNARSVPVKSGSCALLARWRLSPLRPSILTTGQQQ
jgi:hypothetical protein